MSLSLFLNFLWPATGSGSRSQDLQVDGVWQNFLNPPSEFGQMPFWFWNDEITREGITQQLESFKDKGMGGVIVHARMGLSEKIGYLTPSYLALHRFAAEEASRLNLKIILYDEGMYPSGSCHGKVVAEDPALAAQGIRETHLDVVGPGSKTWRIDLETDEKIVSVVLARMDGERMLPESMKMLPRDGPSVRADVGEGLWRMVAILQTRTGGTIRGVFPGEDDHEPGAPPAADILNPRTTASFIRHTHDRLYEAMPEFFGNTIIAMFTDEPSMSGRGGKKGLKSWTPGLEGFFKEHKGYDLLPWLPGLWFDVGEKTDPLRRDFSDILHIRLDESFYAPLSSWCQSKGIALTGHPAASDDIGSERLFQIPGQDVVWRYVVPGDKALKGEHSTMAKCSSSAAQHLGLSRNANEVYGAFGFELTMEEMKWLADWLMVRGVNLLMPHAVYYSVSGPRAYERPPDIGPNNLWWPHYRLFGDYTRRVNGLMSGMKPVCSVAVACPSRRLPWEAAEVLFQGQRDFNYLDSYALDRASIEKASLRVGDLSYKVILVEPSFLPEAESLILLEKACQQGVRILAFGQEPGGLPTSWPLCATGEALLSGIREVLPADLTLTPSQPGLRYTHGVKEGMDFYFLTNEGEGPLRGELTLSVRGTPEVWDPWTGQRYRPRSRRSRDGTHVAFKLDRRQGLVIAFPQDKTRGLPPWPIEDRSASEVSVENWKVTSPVAGIEEAGLGDWCLWPGHENFSGTVSYRATFPLSHSDLNRPLSLDLGRVEDFAEVLVNGQEVGVSFWAPHVLDITDKVREGENILEVRVTNSIANRMEKKSLLSGLFGPVVLRRLK